MDSDSGLRERKKERTRRELTEAALRLFEARGYTSTTVTEIAAAAQVSKATFFNYFVDKEDVLFADDPSRDAVMRETLANRGPNESPRQVLARAVEHLLEAPVWSLDPASDLVAVRARMIATEPALRARALLRVADLHTGWSRALHEAYPDELDELEAAALTGSVVGAVLGAVGSQLRTETARRSIPDTVRRATAVVTRSAAAELIPPPC